MTVPAVTSARESVTSQPRVRSFGDGNNSTWDGSKSQAPVPMIVPGELVAVEAHTAYLWSMNINRIIEVVDSPTRFGFMYATTAIHVEEGEERFVIEFDTEHGRCSI